MKGKRAQAAMEFLMTYGWAILVVLAAGGILAYLGVFNMEQDVAAICKLRPTGQGLDCDTTPYIDANGTVQFTVVNSNPSEVTNIQWDAPPEVCPSGTNLQVANLSRGQSKVFNITGCDTLTAGERYDMKFTMTYNDPNGQTHSNNAKISASAS